MEQMETPCGAGPASHGGSTLAKHTHEDTAPVSNAGRDVAIGNANRDTFNPVNLNIYNRGYIQEATSEQAGHWGPPPPLHSHTKEGQHRNSLGRELFVCPVDPPSPYTVIVMPNSGIQNLFLMHPCFFGCI